MPFIFCICFLKKSDSKDLKVFFVYTILLFISIIAVITFRFIFKSYNSYLLYNRFYLVAEYILISQFFVLNITSIKLRKVMGYSIIPFTLFSIYDYVSSIGHPFTFYPLVFECLLFPAIIILFFYEKMKHSNKYPIYLSPAFWIGVAFLIFSTGNFFLFLFSKLLLQNDNNINLYNNIYGFFTILKNILLCIGIIVAKNYKIQDERSDINTNLELDSFIPFNKK